MVFTMNLEYYLFLCACTAFFFFFVGNPCFYVSYLNNYVGKSLLNLVISSLGLGFRLLCSVLEEE